MESKTTKNDSQEQKGFKKFFEKEKMALVSLPLTAYTAYWVMKFPASWKYGTFPKAQERVEKAIVQLGSISLTDFDGNSLFHKFEKFPFVRYSHSLMALPWTLLIPLQLSLTIRKRLPVVHRIGGRAFLLSSISLMLGYIQMERHKLFYSLNRDGQMPRALKVLYRSSALWFTYTIYRAYSAIKNKRIHEHQIWILRHIASGIFVMIGRLIFIPLAFVFLYLFKFGDINQVEFKKHAFDSGLATSWLFSVLCTEYYIRFHKIKRKRKQRNE